MDNILDKLNNVDLIKSNLQKKFELNFNPFPKSGIAIINDSDNIVSKLAPVDEEVTRKIVTYIHDALYSGSIENQGLRTDKYVSLIVRGEYGSGKTQTLMFIKYLFNNIKNNNIKPYVVYVDNPGQKLSELIGGIVAQIGVENFKKYIWNIFISYLDKQPDIKTDLFRKSYKKEVSLFPISEIENDNYANLTNTVQNYKELIDKLTFGKNNAEKKQLVERLKSHIINSLIPETGSPVVAEYFYDILSETIGVSKSWDMLTTGNVKELDKREVNILKAIVKIVCEQLEYTDFIILIDEFEEITAERLKRTDIDNYLRNLRLLIDREKNWCSVFAMTSKALAMIEEYSAPLAGRIKGTIIDLKPLNSDAIKTMIANYLSVAKNSPKDNSIYPFDESGIKQMLELNENYKQLKGSPRFILKLCYTLLQRASEELNEGETIDSEFVKKYMDDMLN
ncbi:hypothetical protein [Phocaeicola coprocola]|uniref:hypothetical protein n=1 Tax=Phocaeicola coprocola TaxID=310298 RepID=UPI002432F180|nr:hypothetical protein [Phocaeicola coprocola]